jgi:hypothetical protein
MVTGASVERVFMMWTSMRMCSAGLRCGLPRLGDDRPTPAREVDHAHYGAQATALATGARRMLAQSWEQEFE